MHGGLSPISFAKIDKKERGRNSVELLQSRELSLYIRYSREAIYSVNNVMYCTVLYCTTLTVHYRTNGWEGNGELFIRVKLKSSLKGLNSLSFSF